MIDRPFPSYFGGKAGNGTYQTIINNIPQCDVFIDAMVGNGGVVCNLNLPGITVINDIDAGIIANYINNGRDIIIKENMHVADLIDAYDDWCRYTVFYFDPPYLMSSRKSQVARYRYEWSLADHKAFLTKVLTVKSNCMISHYPCHLYDQELRGWNKITYQSMTRHGLATECLYFNYPVPTILQDYRYIGRDYIERQRIKRKINRTIKKLQALPAIERNAIIDAINKM